MPHSPPRLQRIVRYWQIEPYRNFVSWQEDEVFNGCIERGYISPDGEILRTGDEENNIMAEREGETRDADKKPDR